MVAIVADGYIVRPVLSWGKGQLSRTLMENLVCLLDEFFGRWLVANNKLVDHVLSLMLGL